MSFGASLIIPSSTPLSVPFHEPPSLFINTTFLKPTSLTRPCRRFFSSRAAEAASPLDPHTAPTAASEVVRSFYLGINCHELSSVQDLIAHNCVYEDLVFPHPFIGRAAILEFFQKFTNSTSTDLQFVIDDISTEDSSAVGVTWHLDVHNYAFHGNKSLPLIVNDTSQPSKDEVNWTSRQNGREEIFHLAKVAAFTGWRL